MKLLKSIFLPFLLCSLGFSTCQNERVNAENNEIQLTECSLPEGLVEYKKFENQESTIRVLDYDYSGVKGTFYHIGLLDVPAGYLGPCNLPEDSAKKYLQDGQKIRFSGTVYVPKDVDLMNLNSVPVKLTKLEKITENH